MRRLTSLAARQGNRCRSGCIGSARPDGIFFVAQPFHCAVGTDSALEEAGFELLVPQSVRLGGVNAGRHGGAYPSRLFSTPAPHKSGARRCYRFRPATPSAERPDSSRLKPGAADAHLDHRLGPALLPHAEPGLPLNRERCGEIEDRLCAFLDRAQWPYPCPPQPAGSRILDLRTVYSRQ
jgi:hypothetical protein